MRRAWVLAALLTMAPGFAEAASNILTWTDNSNNEATLRVERKIVPNPVPVTAPVVCTAGGYTEIAFTPTNVVTYIDAAVLEDTTYCYQVRARNTAGRYVPLVSPVAPSGLGVGAGP